MIRKKLKWALIPIVAAMSFVSFSSFTNDAETPADFCDGYCQSAPGWDCTIIVTFKSGDVWEITCTQMRKK
jgi:hypothetical protein